MTALFCRLKSQIENDRTSTNIDLTKYDNDILRPELIDTEIYDIYKSIPLDPQQFI